MTARRLMIRLAATAALAAVLLPGRLAAETLTLDEVLSSSATHSPRILEARAGRDEVLGRSLSAEGAFDLDIESKGFSRLSGSWDGRVIDTTVSQDLRSYGVTLFGGYRLSDEDFPIYEDQYFTNSGGEVRAGVVLSLLKDRAIDKERAGLIDAARALDAAETEVLLTRLEVQHKARIAYYKWIAAGLQLRIYEGLLALAEERDRALRRRVREGDVARVLVVENSENVLRRRSLVVEARRQLAVMAQALSVYYRDPQGRPALPGETQLPGSFPDMAPLPGHDAGSEDVLERVKALRPELAIIDANLAQAENRMALARNDLQPTLDLEYEFARDLGSVAEGGSTRLGTDNKVSFVFKLPLQQRDARGRISSAKAKMQALEFKRQQLEERISVEVQTLRLDLEATRELVDLAVAEQEQAEEMQRLERARFRSGASDFFLLNTREERAANARIRRTGAQLRHFSARADYDAATVNLEALGLTP